jgi:pilus assembly protein CpaC
MSSRRLPVLLVGAALLSSSIAPAQQRRADASTQKRAEETEIAPGEDVNLGIGETRTLSARDVKNYSEGVTGIIDIKLTTDGSQFVLNGRRAGSTTLLLIKNDGSQTTLNVNVFARSPTAVEKELGQLLAGINNVQVRRVGAHIVIDGSVANDAELARVKQVASLYPDQVESLVQVGPAIAPLAAPQQKQFLIRIDFYFVQYAKTYAYGVGIGYPESIGGSYITSEFTYDFLRGATTAATATLANQPLPRLDLASSRGWAKVLKQATVITNNDQEAVFNSGGEQNFPVNTGLTIGIERIPFGTELKVMPHYEPAKRALSLKLDADVSDLTAAVSGTALPGRTTSRLTTAVNLKLGQSLVLSGIRSQTLTHTVSGLPVLSDIPLLGLLFGSHSQQDLQTEGAIFVVPSIVESIPAASAELVEIALKRFKDYDGDLENTPAYDKRPGGGVGMPR